MTSAGTTHTQVDSSASSGAASDPEGIESQHWLEYMARIASGHNDSFSGLFLKPIVSQIYPVFVLQYGLLVAVGAVANVLVGCHILRAKLYRDATHAFVLNLVLSHCVQCVVVAPMTLTVMLVQNWVFGQFFCYFLPMLQDIPLHVCMITHLLIAWDRLRWLSDPLKCRLPAFVCCCASWLAGIVITLPYPIYINYMDLGIFIKQFQGQGLCTVNLVDDMHEYMRGLFITLYCVPTVVLSYLYIHTSRELRPPDGPTGIMLYEARAEARLRQSRSHSRPSAERPLSSCVSRRRSYDLYDAEADVTRERKTQRFLGSMAAVQVICISPLMVLRLARLVLEETYDNSGHLDLTFLMFVWLAFLPTVINPWIYATWVLSRPTMERLRGYFRLSTKRSISSSASQPEEKRESAERGPQQKSLRHPQKKRPSESSALTTVSSIRSTVGRPVEKSQQTALLVSVGEASGRSRGPRTSSAKVSSSALSVKDAGHFQFPPSGPETLLPTVGPSPEVVSIQSSVSNLTGTSSNLERDLEIIDLLERERSMDIQQGLARERRLQLDRPPSERRRQLPSVTRHGHSRRNLTMDMVPLDRLLASELSPGTVPGR